jgi:hypothetical protein
MPRGRTAKREEGQVYPALLLAVIGGMAIAVAFLSLQNLLDQGDRADSASDAAALGVGQGFRDDLVGQLTGLGLPGLLALVQNRGDWPGAHQIAQQYADANGADLVGGVQYQGFDANRLRWVFEVETEQKDTVEGGDSGARSHSTSRVAIDLLGLCDWPNGIRVDGQCVSITEWASGCTSPTPTPTPTPTATPTGDGDDEDDPDPEPTPTEPPWTPAPFCGANLASLLEWDIHLIT